MDAVHVRNLEQIREHDARRITSRLGTLLLASLGGAGIVAALMFGSSHTSTQQVSHSDALAQLAARQRTKSSPIGRVESQNVSFPNVLSDSNKPTTALAAVKDEQGRLLASEPVATGQAELPVGSEKIIGSPLATANLLNSNSSAPQARDQLSELATAASQVSNDSALASEGHEGGIQIQVASFRTIEDADALVRDLRHKGHHAFRQPAYVPDRGLWQRVRIGPFKTKIEAIAYRNRLEQTERLLAFVVDPDRKKRAVSDRESVLSSREKKLAPSGT
jgi:cell division septation protein DedD